MPIENLTGGSESLPLTALTEGQVDILRLLGRGRSFLEISQQVGDQNSGINVRKELGETYLAFGVSGKTAAVVHALNIGLLKTEELVEKDFDWSLFETLNAKARAILEAFTHARKESLTEEEFNALNVETTQDPKLYTAQSIRKACEWLGLGGKTEAVVYYYAFRERQQGGENSSAAEKPILTDRETRILTMLNQGMSLAEIREGFRRSIRGPNIKKYYLPSICAKLGVNSHKEALSKAKELGILRTDTGCFATLTNT